LRENVKKKKKGEEREKTGGGKSFINPSGREEKGKPPQWRKRNPAFQHFGKGKTETGRIRRKKKSAIKKSVPRFILLLPIARKERKKEGKLLLRI